MITESNHPLPQVVLTSGALERHAAAERKLAIENLFEHLPFLFGGKTLPVTIRRALQFNVHDTPVPRAANVAHATVVTAVEGIGDTKNRWQRHHRFAIGLIQRGEVLVTFFRL